MGIIQRWRENRTLDMMLREERPELASEVSEETIISRMRRYIRRNDFHTLKSIHEYFPQINPDSDSVQKAYVNHYAHNDMQSAHKLFDIFGIEPEHRLSERIVNVSEGTYRAVVVNKEVKNRLLIKDKYIVTFHLLDEDITFRRKVSAHDFYQKYEMDAEYQLTIPILQRVNMLGHEIGRPYISPSNLLLG